MGKKTFYQLDTVKVMGICCHMSWLCNSLEPFSDEIMDEKEFLKYQTVFQYKVIFIMGFPGGSVVKNPPTKAGDMGLIPGSGRSPGEGNNNPLQYSCLGNPMDRGARWATVHGVTKESDTTQQLNSNNKKYSQSLYMSLYIEIVYIIEFT